MTLNANILKDTEAFSEDAKLLHRKNPSSIGESANIFSSHFIRTRAEVALRQEILSAEFV
jgi:hypothetical protein